MKLCLVHIVLFLFILAAENTSGISINDSLQSKQSSPLIKSLNNYVPGEIIIKFRDDVLIKPVTTSGSYIVGIPSVDNILQVSPIKQVRKVFPGEVKKAVSRIKGNNSTVTIPSLHNILSVSFTDNTADIVRIIDDLKQNEAVEWAEPNYYLDIVNDKPLSPVFDDKSLELYLKSSPVDNLQHPGNAPLTTPNDPLYVRQWGLPAVQADAMWDSTKGDSTQIIAIIDTGVDWLHPDLKNKIWRNAAEVPGNGIDDDGNGYIDDVRGWDWINSDNDPTDDNSHGTHCAGIAAAESNNGIGIAGANWMAKIMPLKVFQSSGRGDASTITQAIIYAKNKGATVINMSFGSYAKSALMEAALANAYPVSLLVAAAGNDGLCIGPEACTDGRWGEPFFPAAFPFVLGVQAPPLPPSGFTNFDQDGPFFSAYPELYNYELSAPGTGIISTVPNGGYRELQGTSMAAPLVSGVVSLYKKLRPLQNTELLWGNLIKSSAGFIQIKNALLMQPKPDLMFINSTIVDTLDGDRDGRPDAGETLQLWFKVRNNWGNADSVKIRIFVDEFEDTSLVHIIIPQATIGSISSYATRTNEMTPLKLRLINTIRHARDIRLKAAVWQPGYPDTVYQPIVLTVENGVELSGLRTGLLHLTEDRFYFVSGNFAVDSLILDPGTILRFRPDASLYIVKYLSANGTAAKKILFTADTDSPWRNISYVQGNGTMRFCIFEKAAGSNYQGTGIIAGISVFENCIFRENVGSMFQINASSFLGCEFINNTADFQVWTRGEQFRNNLVTNNSNAQVAAVNFLSDLVIRAEKNSMYGNAPYDISVREIPWGIYTLSPNYFGTTNLTRINSHIFDFFEEPAIPILNPQNFLVTPSDSVPAHTWKVLVDGKDAQDDIKEPLGTGIHKFEVFFNRAMDTLTKPNVSFGVRPPYTQYGVLDNGKWSPDRKKYTAYHQIKLFTGDGINNVRVEGAKDTDGFEIPVEQNRFNILIDAAGSASAEFQASPGLGKIVLEWNKPDGINDLLGFNLYRFKNLTDTTFTSPELLNPSLLTDTLYTDFSVLPGKRYYYYYKIVRTNFSETDSSRIVSTIPLTAARGDANGDLSINVLDITATVAHILNQNPQPFIFEAADVNHDNQINVLDVVGIVNIILGNSSFQAKTAGATEIHFSKNSCFIKNTTGLTALQFKLLINRKSDIRLIKSLAAKDMEMMYSVNADTLSVIFFNFSNTGINTFAQEELFRLEGAAIVRAMSLLASDHSGVSVALQTNSDGIAAPTDFELQQNYPNPFNPSTSIEFGIPQNCDTELEIYTLLGERIFTTGKIQRVPGYYSIIWNGSNQSGVSAGAGIYLYRLKAGDKYLTKKMLLVK